MTRESFSFSNNPNPDAQLAYLLQHSQPGDPQVLELLIDRSAADLFRLASALGELRQTEHGAADPEPALDLTARVLLHAVQHLDRFWGAASVKSWLYGLALDKLYGRLGRRRLRQAFQQPPRPAPPPRKDRPSLLEALRGLPPAPRLAALLRYGHGLGVEAIALLLQVETGQLHTHLVHARGVLYAHSELPELEACSGWTYDDSQPRERLQQRLDGLLEVDPYAANAFKTHLNECAGCRQAWRDWQEFEKRLNGQLLARWPAPSQPQRQLLAERARQGLHTPSSAAQRLPWRQLSMAALLVLAVVAVGLVFDRVRFDLSSPTSEANLEVLATAQSLSARSGPRPQATPLPTPVEPPRSSQPERLATFAGPNRVWSSQPALSGSGRYLAFASLASYWVPGDANAVADVFLYDLSSGQIERISQTPDGYGGVQASFRPAVSYDGQYVAYYSSAANLLPPGSGPPTCVTLPGAPGFPYSCGDILLYDAASGVTTRVTTPRDPDQALEGEHQVPGISDTGRYVAFFSSARDFAGLAQGFDPSACDPAATPGTCGELYLYDRNLQAMSRLPVGRPLGPDGFNATSISRGNFSPPSISSDGRYVALTLLPGDAAALRPGSRQAVLFDAQSQEFVGLDEQPGFPAPDGDSFNPVVASNGRVAAFVSEASNLVPNDDNQAADVFVRNLASGQVTRVSVSSLGLQGDGPSGVFLADNDQVFEKLSISADGRYVAFVSAAGNLVPELASEDLCWNWEYGSLCAALYLHDTLTGETRLVAEPQKQFVFHQPSLSADGQLLAYSDDRLGCRGAYPYQICADLWLYENESGETRPLSTSLASRLEESQAEAQARSQELQEALEASSAPVQPPDLPALDSEHLVEKPEAHRRRLRTLDVSPDGRLLATGSDDDSVILWEADTLEQIDILNGHRARVTDVRFSPAGDWLATASVEGTVQIWRVDEFARETPLRAFSSLRSRRIGQVEALAFSPDDRWFVIGSRFGLWVWERDGRTFNLRDDLSRPDLNVRALDFSPRHSQLTGTLLAAGLADGSTALYTLPSGNLLGLLGGQDEPVLALAFDPDGEHLAIGGQSNVVDLWQVNLPRRQPLATHQFRFEHQDWVTDLAFSPSGGTLISTSYDDTLRYSDAASGEQQLVTLNPEWRDFLAAQPSPDGTRLYAGRSSGSLMVFSVPQTSDPQLFYQINVTELGSPPPSGLPAELGLGDYPPIMHPENPSVDQIFSADMDDLAGMGLLAPTWLPDGLQFLGGTVLDERSRETLLYYSLVQETTYRGAILVRQGPQQTPDFFAPAIPTGALVQALDFSFLPALETDDSGQQVSGSRVYAELAHGGWVQAGMGQFHWDGRQPIHRLHWTASSESLGQRAFSLEFFDFPDQMAGSLETEDLLDMAASMRLIDQQLGQQPVDLPYTLAQDTSCTRLAAALDISNTALVQINRQHGLNLLQECETLEAGQQLYLPLEPQRYLSQDLDCDGSLEHLRLLRNPLQAAASGSAPENLLGFVLQARQPSGFYDDHALVRVEDNLTQRLLPPALHRRPNSCELFVEVQVGSTETQPLLRLLRWTDGSLQSVLSTPGELTGLTQEGFRLLADTQSVVETAPETCSLRSTRHSWDGEGFVARESSEVELETCPEAGSLSAQGPALESLPPGALPDLARLQAVSDLDCDHSDEYLLAVPDPGGWPGRLVELAVAQTDGQGSLQLLDARNAVDLGGGYMAHPVLLKGGRSSYRTNDQPESCWFALAVEVWGAPEQPEPDGVVVLGWDGSALRTLAELPGSLAHMQWRPPETGQPAAILNREYGQQMGGECTLFGVLYRWNGSTFERVLPQGREWRRCDPQEAEAGNAAFFPSEIAAR